MSFLVASSPWLPCIPKIVWSPVPIPRSPDHSLLMTRLLVTGHGRYAWYGLVHLAVHLEGAKNPMFIGLGTGGTPLHPLGHPHHSNTPPVLSLLRFACLQKLLIFQSLRNFA
jgi:hypothetical protein